jgi:hypothetical protein
MNRPKALQVWDDECKALRERMPRVCFNCYHLDGYTNACRVHGEKPPDDFAETPNACPDWKDEVPF